MIILQLVIFCLLFTVMVKLSTIGGAVNALYFYPQSYQEKAYERGIADRQKIQKKRKVFMLPFCTVMLLALMLILGLWRDITGFWNAYFTALLFLEVMNWYDGIVIDKLWVGKSRLWKISGMEDIPYVQTWKQILHKRVILSLIWFVGAAIVAGLVMLI